RPRATGPRHWLPGRLSTRARHPPWDTVDWDAAPDWEWHSAAGDTPEQLMTLWQDNVARSRSAVAEAMAGGGLDLLAQRTWPDGRAPNLRWIACHMIEGYARHNGHADLIRESVDGLTGEEPLGARSRPPGAAVFSPAAPPRSIPGHLIAGAARAPSSGSPAPSAPAA